MTIRSKIISKESFFFFILAFFAFSLLFYFNITNINEQQFVYLADSFLHGKLYFLQMPGYSWADTTFFNGQHYWLSAGPFSAIILVPFVFLFGASFLQGYVSFFLTLLNFYLLYKIALKLGVKKSLDAFWLAFFYIFATAYIGVAFVSWAWYFAQVVATSLVLLSLYEFFNKRRWWLIGILIALGGLTRITIFVAIIFFLLWIFLEKKELTSKINNSIKLLAPLGFGIMLFFTYNYLRFKNIFNTGGWNPQLDIPEALADLKNLGIYSPKHIVTNLYYLLIKSPDPVFLKINAETGLKEVHSLVYPFIKSDPWGLSIFYTSPLFIYLFKTPLKEKMARLSLITSISILTPILLYGGIGFQQFGYRYALDFYPFLFIALVFVLKDRLNNFHKGIIIISFVLNFYLLLSAFNLGFLISPK